MKNFFYLLFGVGVLYCSETNDSFNSTDVTILYCSDCYSVDNEIE